MRSREAKRRVGCALAASLGIFACVGSVGDVRADGTVTGHGRFEKIKGKPHMGYAELYETNLFLSPYRSPPIGPSRRLGAPGGGQGNTYDGFYSITIRAGTYSILINQPLFYVRPKVLSHVLVQDNQTTTAHVELPVDYSTYTWRDVADWTWPAPVWYQTFTATGTSVTGANFVLADDDTNGAWIAILEDNGDPDVRNWTWLGARQVDESRVGANGDHWARWRSGEIPLVPGRRYAMAVMGFAGPNGDGLIQPYRRNKDANSYTGGRAYDANGVPQDFDLCYVVFADNDGTRVTMNKRTTGIGSLQDGNYGQRWGQTFIARGRYLAGVDVWAAGADHVWDLDFTWRVYDGLGGLQLGATKTTKAAYQAFGAGLHGASYSHGEVPLVPGRTYYIEFTNSVGFNPYVMDSDRFDEGMAVQNGVTRPDIDLNMTILEYTEETMPPTILRQPASFSHTITLGESVLDEVFTVRNTGGGTLNYTITDNVSWLAVSPSAGTSTGEADPITVSYDLRSLPPGSYSATITIADPAGTNSPQEITVSLVIRLHPVDLDTDGDVDLSDFGLFQLCYNGPNRSPTANCSVDADLDDDGDVDLTDFGQFQGCYNGPNRPPACPGI